MPQTVPVPGKLFQATFSTPTIEDVYLYERVQTFGQGYKFPQYGDQVPEKYRIEWPEHKVCLIAPDKEVGDGWSIIVYAKDRERQDDYNFTVDYPTGSNAFPHITRTYVYPREQYLEDGPLALGTADPGLKNGDSEAMFPGCILVLPDKEEDVDDKVLQSLFIKVTRVFMEVPDLSDSGDLAAAKLFGTKTDYPYGLINWPRVTWRVPCNSEVPATPLTTTCPIPGYTTAVFGDTTPLTGGATNGTTSVTVASTARLYPGALITGTDIPVGATVVSITSGTVFVLSAAATGTHSSLTFTVGYYLKLLDQSYEREKEKIVALIRIYEPVYGPLIPESDVDQTTFRAARTTKQIIAQSAMPATPALLTAEMTAAFTGGSEVQIEYKPMGMDGLRSIRIVSERDWRNLDWMINLDNRFDILSYGLHVYNYWPDVLEAVTLYRAESAGYSASIAMGAYIKQAYRGPCVARFTKRYTSDPTSANFFAGLPTIKKWLKRADTIVAGFASVRIDGVPISDSRTWTIPETIHPEITVGLYGSSVFYDGGFYTASLPATPTQTIPPFDEWVVFEITHRQVGFKLWEYTIIEGLYPYP